MIKSNKKIIVVFLSVFLYGCVLGVDKNLDSLVEGGGGNNDNIKIVSVEKEVGKDFDVNIAVDNSIKQEKDERLQQYLKEKRQTLIVHSGSISGGEEESLLEYDMLSDDSMYKFVNNKISFNKKEYIPKNLIAINGEFILDVKGYSKLRKVALDNLQELGEDFYKKFKLKLKVVSAYRSYEYQAGIKRRGCPDNLCSKAGYSEHQSGLAIDLWEVTTEQRFKDIEKLKKYFDWMNNNAHNFGFINTYQKGIEIDGYEIEPWHWRYIGQSLAKKLKKEKITFAEFYKKTIISKK